VAQREPLLPCIVRGWIGLRGRLVAVHRGRSWPEFSRWPPQQSYGVATELLLVYSLGLAVPFLLTAAAISRALGALNRIKRYRRRY